MWNKTVDLLFRICYNNSMKFDAVIGNPPYDKNESARNTKLWYTFSEMVLDLSDVIAFVTPNAVVSSKGVNGKKLRDLFKERNYGFIEAVNHVSPWFKGVGVDTCHWIVQKGVEDKVNPIQNNNAEVIPDVVMSICNKVVSYQKKLPLKMMNGHIKSKECNDLNGNVIYFSGDKPRFTRKDVETGNLKLVMPFSSSYHKMFVTNEATGQLNLVLEIESEEEGQMIIDYCQTPLFKIVANNYRKTSGFTPFVKNCMVPDLREKDISDLYNIFDLTQEEIDYVERNS